MKRLPVASVSARSRPRFFHKELEGACRDDARDRRDRRRGRRARHRPPATGAAAAWAHGGTRSSPAPSAPHLLTSPARRSPAARSRRPCGLAKAGETRSSCRRPVPGAADRRWTTGADRPKRVRRVTQAAGDCALLEATQQRVFPALGLPVDSRIGRGTLRHETALAQASRQEHF